MAHNKKRKTIFFSLFVNVINAFYSWHCNSIWRFVLDWCIHWDTHKLILINTKAHHLLWMFFSLSLSLSVSRLWPSEWHASVIRLVFSLLCHGISSESHEFKREKEKKQQQLQLFTKNNFYAHNHPQKYTHTYIQMKTVFFFG